MGFLLIFVFLGIVTCVLTLSASRGEDRSDIICRTVTAACVWTLIAAVLMIVSWSSSYYTYLGLKQRLVTIEQYRSAIQMYSDRGILDFKKHETGGLSSGRIGDLTDLKYQSYQAKMASMIEDLRSATVGYNNILIGKETMKASWFWSWCIIGPDPDMKPLKMAKGA